MLLPIYITNDRAQRLSCLDNLKPFSGDAYIYQALMLLKNVNEYCSAQTPFKKKPSQGALKLIAVPFQFSLDVFA